MITKNHRSSEDSARYLKLTALIIVSFVAFLLVITGIFLLLRLIFGLVDQLSWTSYIYSTMVLAVPAAVFMTAYIIFLLRTVHYPSKPVRIISFVVFAGFILAWAIFFVMDMYTFIGSSDRQIKNYKSWDTLFLALSVAGLFLTGVMQALAAEKEEDWLERNRRINP